MLYEGKNPLRLDGIDSAHADKYFLSVSHFIPIQREGNKFYLDINLYALSHDIVTIPGSITVFIYEINLLDTVLMGSQEMDIVGGQLPQPTIMVGENALTPERESKKELLANPSFSLTSQYSDYSSCFKISGFSITIGSQTYFCKSYSLSAEIINALKNYKGKYVTVPNVYATSPDGFTVQFVSSSK